MKDIDIVLNIRFLINHNYMSAILPCIGRKNLGRALVSYPVTFQNRCLPGYFTVHFSPLTCGAQEGSRRVPDSF